ncbi:hypothetical protein [Uliginosibacterium sp. H1]|uniref:hypothetical protein n=1 Tax=Uliginosibacterium sp. H1 TaxID=3114757 RepID=UPI002E181139|nr:hypothetical protein [Uliginosibacterium sp. H1]
MKKTNSRLLLSVLAAASLTLGLAACEKEGPAERAGKSIDETLGTKKEPETLGEKAAETGEAIGQKVEDAGEKIQDSADKK